MFFTHTHTNTTYTHTQDAEPNTKAKYLAECRGLYGVMMVKDSDGVFHGHKMQPFNYTSKKVIGPVRFEKMFWAEVNRVNNLKTTGTLRSKYWKERGEHLEGGAYEARYGRRLWRKKVIEKLGKGSNAVCNVCDLMAHAIKEGNRLFANTIYHNTWILYHDALSAWWSEGAQAYMRSRNFEHRQVRGLGLTNNGTRCCVCAYSFAFCIYSTISTQVRR